MNNNKNTTATYNDNIKQKPLQYHWHYTQLRPQVPQHTNILQNTASTFHFIILKRIKRNTTVV